MSAQDFNAAKRRRGQALTGALTGVAVIVVLVVVFIGIKASTGDDTTDEAAAPAASSAAPAAPAVQLDPALQQQPEITAGKGDVTKLLVTPIIEGTGPAVTAGQTISANYIGVTYSDGKVFDSSWSSGQPVSFPVGVGNLIQGWDQGLVGVPVGSRVQLDIPADLAYGENPTGGQPAGDLRFVVDILSAS